MKTTTSKSPVSQYFNPTAAGTCELRDCLGFKSKHQGGAQFAFADGSVHLLAETIDYLTYSRLGCRRDGNPVGAGFDP